jgi:hypothetical protein
LKHFFRKARIFHVPHFVNKKTELKIKTGYDLDFILFSEIWTLIRKQTAGNQAEWKKTATQTLFTNFTKICTSVRTFFGSDYRVIWLK